MTFSDHITLPDIHRMPVCEAISCKRSRRALRRIRDALQKIPTRMSLKGAAVGFSTTSSPQSGRIRNEDTQCKTMISSEN